MADLILVHGAWHGAWCWDDLISRLQALGHDAHAYDLPGAGSDPTPLAEVTLPAYAESVVDHLKAAPRPVWLVGHSMGGMVVTQAAALAPERVAGLIYVTAAIPMDGQSMADLFAQWGAGSVADHMLVDEAGAWVPPERLREVFYNLCDDAQVERARRLLNVRQAMAPTGARLRVPPGALSGIPRLYVECLRDHALPIGLQRRMYEAAGVTAVASLDTDHSPFLSRPDALAEVVHGFVGA